MKRRTFSSMFSSSFFLYVLSAVLLILSFPRFNFWPLAWAALVPLMFALDGRGRGVSFRIGYLCGILFFGAMLLWLCFVTCLGTVLFVLYLALYFGLFGLGYHYCSRARFSARLILIPCLWVALEYARAHVLTGFGWVLLGHTQSSNLALIQIADTVGVYGISFLIVMVNVWVKEGWSRAVERRSYDRSFFTASAFVILLLAISYVYGVFQLRKEYQGPSLRVGLAQGNISLEKRWHPKAWPLILKDHLDLSRKLADQGADLIVWPESAYPGYPWEDPKLFAALQDSIRQQNVAHLIGVVTKEGADYFNTAIAFDPQGRIVDSYHKIRLVPFGEFIPLRERLPFLSQIVPIDDFTPGQEFVVLEALDGQKKAKYLYSVLICFEDTVPDVARNFVRKGAHFLINISNDAWFGDTREPWLHLQNAVFRSIENRRFLVRCGNVGISCLVDPWGRVTSAVADPSGKMTYVPGVSVADVGMLRSQTLYTKFGDWFAYFCISGILMWIVTVILRYQKKKNA